MSNTPSSRNYSYLSTGVVSRALGLDQSAVRAMIKSGSLPEPQWMSLGTREERVYSLEWLILANEQVNGQRLSGLELQIAPENSVQFALRFKHDDWTLQEVTAKLVCLEQLWHLCVSLFAETGNTQIAPLQIRKLSAGSPLDILAWVPESVKWAGFAIATMLYLLKYPDRVSSAIPRAIAAWREHWAKADEQVIHQLTARIERKKFVIQAKQMLADLDCVPSDTALSGVGTSRLEIISAEVVDAVSKEIESGKNVSPESID